MTVRQRTTRDDREVATSRGPPRSPLVGSDLLVVGRGGGHQRVVVPVPHAVLALEPSDLLHVAGVGVLSPVLTQQLLSVFDGMSVLGFDGGEAGRGALGGSRHGVLLPLLVGAVNHGLAGGLHFHAGWRDRNSMTSFAAA